MPTAPSLEDLLKPKPVDPVVPPAVNPTAVVNTLPIVGTTETVAAPVKAESTLNVPVVSTPQIATHVKVQLKDCPPFVFPLAKVTDRWGAVEAYKKVCGIISTPHNFDIEYTDQNTFDLFPAPENMY